MVMVSGDFSISWSITVVDISCRLVTLEDSNDILNWRNDTASREMSLNARFISLVEHSNWFEGMLNNGSHIGLIGELNSEKIGVVFMKIHKSNAKVSLNLNPLHRGKRLGSNLLRSSMLEVQKLLPKIRQFTAEIKNTNTASIKVFAQNGFKLHAKKNGFSSYSVKSISLGVK